MTNQTKKRPEDSDIANIFNGICIAWAGKLKL